MQSRRASTTIIIFLSFSIIPLLTIVRAHNHSVHCPPPPPCICICNPTPPPPPSNTQPPLPQPDPRPPTPPTFQPAPPPNDQPQPPSQTTPPPPLATTPPPLPPKALPPPLSPPQTTPPPPPAITPPPPPPPGGICSKNDSELKICAEILRISDGLLTTGRAEPCCSIVRNVSDVDAVTCLCKSVGARPLSLSPNFGIFFKVCGRRIPQGFSCPGSSPTISPPPLPPQTLPPPPPQTTPPPPLATTPPPLPPKTLPPLSPPQTTPHPPPVTTPPLSPPLVGTCSKNDTELKICAEILAISGGVLTTGRAEPCCSIVRNVSDVDAVTCFCKSVGARQFSLSPNFGNFFKVCGRRIPQGFSCPGPSPTISPPPLPPQTLPPPPPQTTPPPPPATTPPLSPPLVGTCSKNDTELKICAEILAISGSVLTTGRAEPCCSIVRNVSDVDAVTCFCKSVGARRFSLSPNFGNFFKVCGRRIPQGFSCP